LTADLNTPLRSAIVDSAFNTIYPNGLPQSLDNVKARDRTPQQSIARHS